MPGPHAARLLLPLVLPALLALGACGEGQASGIQAAGGGDGTARVGPAPGRAAPLVMLFRTASGWRLEARPPAGTPLPATLELEDGHGGPLASGPGSGPLCAEIPAGAPVPFRCRARWPGGETSERSVTP
jgi:hypothetical protein